jgi:NAD(P)-dependent dehydrogenase (short-subunit alcohol dehydrogenase family)
LADTAGRQSEEEVTPQHTALLVGNSDGMGLATTKRLLARGWNVIGISRSESPIKNTTYRHRVLDVGDSRYSDLLGELVRDVPLDLCIYFVGIGAFLDLADMSGEPGLSQRRCSVGCCSGLFSE